MPLTRLRRTLLAAAATTAVGTALALAPAPAFAATGDTGWVRVAHLSPDTRQVDVRIAPLGGDGDIERVTDVAYGAVSDYLALPTGTYAIAMRPAGAADDAPPVVETSAEVTAGDAATIAVVGLNADLRTEVIPDELSVPAAGNARARVVQASTSDDPVTLNADGGPVLAEDAGTGDVSKYSDVPAGEWKLTAQQGEERSDSTVTLKAGQIATLFVLDDADGGLVVRRVLDSSSAGELPKGYVATGGGYLVHQGAGGGGLVTGGILLMLLGAAAGVVLLRRRATAG